MGYADRLRIEVIPGGLPAVGRNAGARLADTRYVLFIDADVVISDRTMLRRAMQSMEVRHLHCLTTSIGCMYGRFVDDLLYAGNNLIQRMCSWFMPFGTGMFLMFERTVFDRLGGFNEQALYAEDYLLTQKVSMPRFGILRGKVHTTNRRFRKMGRRRIVWMFFRTALNSFNRSYYMKDQDYWTET